MGQAEKAIQKAQNSLAKKQGVTTRVDPVKKAQKAAPGYENSPGSTEASGPDETSYIGTMGVANGEWRERDL